ncbi:hypothetical protein FGB62_37g22 [Gracilaria domingensis]|nr:hypothetical protein FGB62_37g22 [Gracilaria domingensis]
MKAIASLERARDECSAQLDAREQSLLKDMEKELEHKVEKLNHEYKMKLMRLSEQELSTLVGQMVYELGGDVSNLLVKEMESVADRILQEDGDGADTHGGSGSTQMQLEALKTPKARSLRRAVVAATTERKRVNRERCVATRASVRRSTRKAAQTATARTRELFTSAARSKGAARVADDVQSVEGGDDTEADNMSAPVMAAVANEIARLRGMADSREGLRAFKAQLDSAFGEIV